MNSTQLGAQEAEPAHCSPLVAGAFVFYVVEWFSAVCFASEPAHFRANKNHKSSPPPEIDECCVGSIAMSKPIYFMLLPIAVEYALRLWSCGDGFAARRKFVLAAANIVDLVAFLPFYVTGVACSRAASHCLRTD